MDRLKRVVEVTLLLYALAGAVMLVVLVAGSPLRIGEGRFQAFVAELERFDFKSLLLGVLVAVWLVPLGLGLLWRQARNLGFESTRLKTAFEPLLRPVPVKVDVDTRIPVRVAEPLAIPVELDARLPIDEEIEIEAEIPLRMEIPIDTEVETTVMRFGTLRVPVRATIPVDLVLPVKGRVRARASIPVALNEVVRVQLPAFEVPVASRMETRIDLVANLRRRDEEAA